MSYTFLELQNEVKRRAILDQGGTQFENETKNAINSSLIRIAREAPWKPLRRVATFQTEAPYSVGSGAVSVTNNTVNVTVTGATFITNNIKVGRRITIGGSNKQFTIATITGETTLTLNQLYDGTTSTTQTYKIFGTEEYNLPIQTGKIGLIWHEAYGYPYKLEYVTDNDFIESSTVIITEDIPNLYRMWGDDTVIRQPNSPSVMRVFSSNTSDVSVPITIFGLVSGFPDFEIISTNGATGTTPVPGLKTFSSIERIAKGATTLGRITVDCNSAAVVVATLPVGSATDYIFYKKIKLFPLPTSVYPVNVQYYKEPWELVNDGDIHELGQDFDEAIILLSVCKINFGQKEKEGTNYFQLYQDELKTLRRVNVDSNLDWKPILRRAKDSRRRDNFFRRGVLFNQLGGYYGPMGYQ